MKASAGRVAELVDRVASCPVIAASGNQADAFTPALKAHASCAQGQ
jgi:hypothetical protein